MSANGPAAIEKLTRLRDEFADIAMAADKVPFPLSVFKDSEATRIVYESLREKVQEALRHLSSGDEARASASLAELKLDLEFRSAAYKGGEAPGWREYLFNHAAWEAIPKFRGYRRKIDEAARLLEPGLHN